VDEIIKDFNEALQSRVAPVAPSKMYTYTNSPERWLVERDNYKVREFELDAREVGKMERLIKERNLSYENLTNTLERVFESAARNDRLEWGPGEWCRSTAERVVDEFRGYAPKTQTITGRELHKMIQEELDFYKKVDPRAEPWLQKHYHFEEHRIYQDDPAKWVENNVKALTHIQKTILPYHMETEFSLPQGNIHDIIRSSRFEDQWSADWQLKKTNLAKAVLSHHAEPPAVSGYSHGSIFRDMARDKEQVRAMREGLERDVLNMKIVALRPRGYIRRSREETLISLGKDAYAERISRQLDGPGTAGLKELQKRAGLAAEDLKKFDVQRDQQIREGKVSFFEGLPERQKLIEEVQETGRELRIVETHAFPQDQPRFKCNSCGSVYEDHYPTDDSCVICNQGLVRLTGEPANKYPFGPFDQSAERYEAEKPEVRETGKKPAHDGQVVYERIKNLSAEVQRSVPLRPVERQPARLEKLASVPAVPFSSKGLEKG
jgi:hypothetical protein